MIQRPSPSSVQPPADRPIHPGGRSSSATAVLDVPPAVTPDLAAFLASSELFATLEPAALRAILNDLVTVDLQDGDLLIRRGEDGDALYLIVAGRIRVVVDHEATPEQVLAELWPGQSVGEVALLTHEQRTASAYAVGPTRLVKLTRAAFDRFGEQHPDAMRQVLQVILRRLQRVQLGLVLRQNAQFNALPAEALRALEAELEYINLPGQQPVFRQDEAGDCLYIVISGRVRVVAGDPQAGERTLAELGCGESIGEMALLTGEPRTATVYTIRDTHLARLSRAGFDRVLAKHPRAMTEVFTRTVIGRLRTPTVAKHRFATVALVPASPDVPLADFTARFTEAMATLGPTLRVSSGSVTRTLGEDHAQALTNEPNHIRLMHWLDEQETRDQYVVYEADTTATAWTSRCIRAADRVVVVGRAEADPAPGELERALSACAAGTTKQSLVLLHRPDREQASGTASWLAPRPACQHFHVRQGRQGDVERLARILTGRAVGLVLGGGGARGFAHVGIIKALGEAGIPIDVVGGTSMGAMIAAQHAAEWAPETMLARTIAGAKKAFDLTFPLVSLIAGRKAGTMLREFVGDSQIEDLWLPFFCVSANLTRGQVKVHRCGSLLKGLLASNAAPGIYPPVVDDGDLLVDGALLNNVPVDVMQSFAGVGTIIAVDACPPVDLDQNVDYGMGLSGWRVFWSRISNRINPASGATPFPSIASILMRSTMLGSVNHHNAVVTSLADLYLRPPVDRYPLHAYAAGPDIARVGYQYARERLAEWRPVL